MADESEPPSGGDRKITKRRKRKLRIVRKKPSATAAAPPGGPGKHLFGKGNQFYQRRKRRDHNPVQEIDAVAKDTIKRLRTLSKKKERQMAAPTANAVFVGLRLRMDILGQYELGRKLAEQAEEIEELTAVVAERLGFRGPG
jgi:hypothetical protein